MTDPSRPDGVPEDAEWNPEENEWELGPKNADNEPIGDWVWWDPSGRLVCKASYDDHGELHGLLERWHPNGERAQWAPWVHGKTHGVQVWTLATTGESDRHSQLPPNLSADVRRMDMPYYHGVPDPYHFTLFSAAGLDAEVVVDDMGRVDDLAATLERALPETTLLMLEPAKSIQGATLADNLADQTRWILAGRDNENWLLREHGTGEAQTWTVTTEMLNRCFTLSTNAYLIWTAGRRPAGVPEDAHFERSPRRWWAGPLDDGKRVGDWQAWDEDGNLRAEQSYSSPDVLDGAFRLLHLDGSTAASGEWRNGRRSGRWVHDRGDGDNSDFPVEHASVARVLIDYDGAGRELSLTCFKRDGTACLRDGHELPAVDEDIVGQPIDGWLRRYQDENPPSRAGDATRQALEQWEELYGQKPHPDLAEVTAFILSQDSKWGYAWNWRVLVDGTREIVRGNVFENFVKELQRWHLNRALIDAFTGTTSLGRQDHEVAKQYVLGWFESEQGLIDRPPIYQYDETSLTIDGPLTVDVDHLVYMSAAASKFRSHLLSVDGFAQVWRSMSGSFRPRGQWTGVAELYAADSFEPWERDALSADLTRLSRSSRWIIELLRGEREVGKLIELDDASLDDPLYSTENAVKHVPIGLYVMWRMFFLEQDEDLGELLSLMADSPARLLRDCAALLNEVLYGREDVGSIEDIHEVRDDFLELGLTPGYSPN